MGLHTTLSPHTAPSSSPTIITANATSSTSLRLEWTVPENSTHNGVIRSYTVVLEEQETGLLLTYQEAGGTVREVSSLHPYYVYKCQVQAFTVAHGPLSEPVYITTFEDSKESNLYMGCIKQMYCSVSPMPRKMGQVLPQRCRKVMKSEGATFLITI